MPVRRSAAGRPSAESLEQAVLEALLDGELAGWRGDGIVGDPSMSLSVDTVASITVVLSCWKRPGLLAEQIRGLREQSVRPHAVWVWWEKTQENAAFRERDFDVDAIFYHPSVGGGVYGRWALSLLASTEYVFMLDDDTFPGENYISVCLDQMRISPGILSAAGVRLLGASYRPAERYGWSKPSSAALQVDFGCNSWFLKREWIPFLWSERPFRWNNGEDMQLSFLVQKTGGIRTFTPAQAGCGQSGQIKAWRGRGREALFHRPSHYDERTEQLKHQIRSGWKTVYGRAEAALLADSSPM